LLAAIVPFRTPRENFNDDARILDDIGRAIMHLRETADDRSVGINEVAGRRNVDLQVGGEGSTREATQRSLECRYHVRYEAVVACARAFSRSRGAAPALQESPGASPRASARGR